MKALIFAAGLGTRLRPLTDTRPKAMVEVAGKPLIAHAIERLVAAGFNEIVVNVHHFGGQIIDFVENYRKQGIDIRISDEREQLLDTGGGIRRAATLFTPDDTPFLIHNVDIFSNLDLAAFYAANDIRQRAATLLVSNRKTSRYLLFHPQEMRLMGWTNVQTGEVKSPYAHLNPDECRALAFAGIHLFAPSLAEHMQAWDARFSIIDFYLAMADKVEIKGVEVENLELIDVGKPETLSQAESFLQKQLLKNPNY